MREFKFRAWRIDDARLLSNFWIDGNGQYWIKTDDGYFLPEPFKSKVIIMQYIGLKDKNGKEIYEGDLLLCNGSILAEVDYFPCSYEIYAIGDDPKGLVDDLNRDFNEYGGVNVKTGNVEWVKVVGNIYENPELIEDDNI